MMARCLGIGRQVMGLHISEEEVSHLTRMDWYFLSKDMELILNLQSRELGY